MWISLLRGIISIIRIPILRGIIGSLGSLFEATKRRKNILFIAHGWRPTTSINTTTPRCIAFLVFISNSLFTATMEENTKTARMTRLPIAVCLEERPIAECRPTRLISLEQPAPSSTEKEFWPAGLTEIPSFASNPWDFYEPFLTLSSGRRLVLSNDRTVVRDIRDLNVAPPNESPYITIRHKNFVNIYETYLFKGESSAIVEYVGLSLEDLLQKSICFSEPEIAYIISQVSRALSSSNPTDVVGFGRHKIHLVQETRSCLYIHTKYSVVHERRGQTW